MSHKKRAKIREGLEKSLKKLIYVFVAKQKEGFTKVFIKT